MVRCDPGWPSDVASCVRRLDHQASPGVHDSVHLDVDTESLEPIAHGKESFEQLAVGFGGSQRRHWSPSPIVYSSSQWNSYAGEPNLVDALCDDWRSEPLARRQQ